MPRLMHFPAVGALVLVLGACTGPDQTPEEFLDAEWPEDAGGTVIAVHGEETILCTGHGFADRENGIPADCDTVYDIMSMTKQFTAAAVLKLQMMGELEVTDPVSEHLGPVSEDKQAITVHHLLIHAAGLPEELGGDYEPLSREEMVSQAMDSELLSAPGEEYHYSNVGYSLLAAIVEEVSGVGYEEFLAEHLFTPAGMAETGYVLPDWDPEQIAVEYDDQDAPQGTPIERRWDDDGPYWNLRGNGGLLSTAGDMARWHHALREELVLDRQATEQMFEPHILEYPDEETYYGYGWVVESTNGALGDVTWHDGGGDWTVGMMVRDDDFLVFWVTNQAVRQGEWDLEEDLEAMTFGLAEQLAANPGPGRLGPQDD